MFKTCIEMCVLVHLLHLVETQRVGDGGGHDRVTPVSEQRIKDQISLGAQEKISILSYVSITS